MFLILGFYEIRSKCKFLTDVGVHSSLFFLYLFIFYFINKFTMKNVLRLPLNKITRKILRSRDTNLKRHGRPKLVKSSHVSRSSDKK